MPNTLQLELPTIPVPRPEQPSGSPVAASLRSDLRPPLTVAGLFAGIGGIELGLKLAGHRSDLYCENNPAAQAVLKHQFPGVEIHDDVRTLDSVGSVDLVAAGFPCQDLSQAGATKGINGDRSGLVSEVFRLIEQQKSLRWVLLENVPFMLHLQRGAAMGALVAALEGRGFRWAYRVVDSRAFGLPQRRQRVVMLASRTEDPRSVLFADDAHGPLSSNTNPTAFGFYWTEGIRGLGWAEDAIPTLKGGSTIGIPSPPAIWFPESRGFALPEIRDAERLQGFPSDWTLPVAKAGIRAGERWKLIGNAVSVPVAEWIGQRLRCPGVYDHAADTALPQTSPWPSAAWGADGERHESRVTPWPVRRSMTPIRAFLQFPPKPLSMRATRGFLDRTRRSSLRFPSGFLEALESYLRGMDPEGTT